MTSKNEQKLTRSRKERILFGVCGGLANYFGMDPTIIRLLFVVLTLAGGSGPLLYIILAFVVPEEKEGKQGNREKNLQNFAKDVGKRAQNLAGEIKKSQKNQEKIRNLLGLGVILLGIILLVQQFVNINAFINWDFVWPGAIILIGLLIIFKK